MDVAILLLVWRRPILTKKIISSLRKISPKKIYVSSDGPIKNDINNSKLVDLVRKIVIEEIDWECEVITNYSEINKGCKIAVSDGISWFFNYEEEGIILEDDCLPSKDFFRFCSVLLQKYRDDKRIWAICGNGYQQKKINNNDSYFFSRYADVWGWATWKRCWEKYDKDIKSWKKNKSLFLMENVFENKRELKYWIKIFDNLLYSNKPDTWDYQWQYLCFINSGMICMPYVNLVKNIGFGEGATHTTDFPIIYNVDIKKFGKIKFPLKHPSTYILFKDCNQNLREIFYSGYSIFSLKGLLVRSKKLVLKFKKARSYFKNLIFRFYKTLE